MDFNYKGPGLGNPAALVLLRGTVGMWKWHRTRNEAAEMQETGKESPEMKCRENM